MTPSQRIGFISTRFAGTDGVSLETAKWATVLQRMGYECFYFCGECDREPQHSYIVPEAFFGHPVIAAINQAVYPGAWGRMLEDCEDCLEIKDLHQAYFSIFIRPPRISKQVQELKDDLKQHLYQFARKFQLHALIIENALTIPINLPLGLAI
ncbi:MAG: hypothetical protein IH586_19110, partial [Anaerolineaceae bacterium]|nr:hypothetical protein [Anaerolineaceae bacterium]